VGQTHAEELMQKRSLVFTQPFSTTIEEGPLPEPKGEELLVANRMSAISAGTEMLVFKGHFPEEMAVDASINSLSGPFSYPINYGYSSVGQVIAAGSTANAEWIGREVFAFHPHTSHFTATPEVLLPLPDGVSIEDAVFLANMETAVNLVLDGRPLIGEQIVVYGMGIIGLLTMTLLSHYPLRNIIGIDPIALRRETAANLGADMTLAGEKNEMTDALAELPTTNGSDRCADLIYELSGNPEALNTALRWAGFHSRIVIGSWYGIKSSPIDLGGPFHRNRITVTSSQVSTIAPSLAARWTPQRRLQTAWRMIAKYQPGHLVSHYFDINEAQQAYELLAERPQEVLQVVLTYPPN
jgi:2-desacetyl-2-hydroxyethyl bacteriochlorophyllide A dehydrogenase